MPVDPVAPFADENVRLALAPTNPKDFHTLAVEMAEILTPPGSSIQRNSNLKATA